MPEDDALARWLADARVESAAAERAKVRRLVEQAREDLTLDDLLHSLDKRDVSIAIVTVNGTTHHGRVQSIGRDVVVMAAESRAVLIALDAISAVRITGRSIAAPTGRAEREGLTLASVLSAMSEDRPRVTVGILGATVSGELRGVGDDVAVIAVEAAEPATTYVALASVVEVSVFACG